MDYGTVYGMVRTGDMTESEFIEWVTEQYRKGYLDGHDDSEGGM